MPGLKHHKTKGNGKPRDKDQQPVARTPLKPYGPRSRV